MFDIPRIKIFFTTKRLGEKAIFQGSLNTIWSRFNVLTRKHFYHIGGFEKNRNPMLEALVTNFKAIYIEEPKNKPEQLTLFKKAAELNAV